MEKLLIAVGLLFLFLTLIFTSPVSAASDTQPAVKTLPIISKNGLRMGEAIIERRKHLLYIDYDLGAPFDCLLTGITTHIRNQNRTYIAKIKDSQSRYLQYEATYIGSRDAVIAYDVGDKPISETLSLFSRLEFDCNSYHQTAWISADGKAVGDNQLFTYQANSKSSIFTRIWNRIRQPAPVDDGYRIVYNRDKDWWEWRHIRSPSTSDTTDSSSSIRQPAPVDDGYRLVFNRDKSWWEYVRRSEL